MNLYVQPVKAVTSYLAPLTGLSKELIEEKGIPLEEALEKLKEHLPKNAILGAPRRGAGAKSHHGSAFDRECVWCAAVGQNIGKDVEWCRLERGVDFGDMIDLAPLFRVFDNSHGKYQYFR